MAQQECDDVKAMLKELGTLVPKIEALKKSIDSGEDIEEIKKTKEALERVLKKHGILRYSLKEWERRSKSIQRIDEIAEKLKKEENDTDLSIDELHAIHMAEVWETEYEIFNFKPILGDVGHNYCRYNNLKVCRKNRSREKQKEDYARIYGCKPEQVTSNLDNVFKKNSDIVVFIGEELDFTDQKLPETLKHVSGNLQSHDDNAKLPKKLEYVDGDLYLYSLKEIPAEGLELPKKIEGDLELRFLESAKGLVLPETIGGDLNLHSLKEIPTEGLELPKKIEGDLYLKSLTSAEGLVLPETIGGHLYLYSLTSAEGLVLPETIGGYLDLPSLKSAKGLVLPKTVGGSLNLRSLESAKGLEKINYAGIIGDIYLPKAFSDKDKEEVKKIKIEQAKKGINVNFEYL